MYKALRQVCLFLKLGEAQYGCDTLRHGHPPVGHGADPIGHCHPSSGTAPSSERQSHTPSLAGSSHAQHEPLSPQYSPKPTSLHVTIQPRVLETFLSLDGFTCSLFLFFDFKRPTHYPLVQLPHPEPRLCAQLDSLVDSQTFPLSAHSLVS